MKYSNYIANYLSMLKYIIFFYLIFYSIAVSAQLKNTSYFDEKGRLSYEETAVYFRKNTDTINYFRSYYAKNKSKYFEGIITNACDTLDFNNKYKGLCNWYYPNGNLKIQSEYNDEGLLNGIKKEFSLDGSLRKKTIYENGKVKDKKYIEYNENNIAVDVFEEDFSNNSMNWELETSEYLNSKIKIGGLEIVNKTTKEYFKVINKLIDSENYSIETNINAFAIEKDCKSGIVFGFKDRSNYGYFYISKRKFHVGFIRDNKVVKKIDDYFSVDLKTNDFNKLNIQFLNDSLYFYINNTLQCYSSKEELLDTKIGFYVSNGYYFFDYLVVKAIVSKKTKNPIGTDQLFFSNKSWKFPARQINSGVIIGENGYILTSIKDIEYCNSIFVEINCNDTLKRYEAEIFLNSSLYNFAVLKIKDSTVKVPKPIYNVYTYSSISEKSFIAYNFEKDSLNNLKRNKFTSDFKTINNHQHIEYSGLKHVHYCVGSAMFNAKGDILGIITSVDKGNMVNTTIIRRVIDLLFTHRESNEIKPKANFDYANFENDIYQNIVIVKTL